MGATVDPQDQSLLGGDLAASLTRLWSILITGAWETEQGECSWFTNMVVMSLGESVW